MDVSKEQVALLLDRELLLLRAYIRAEMRERGLADSVGATGEKIAMECFKAAKGRPILQLAPPGTKNVDALSREGDRYSIKTVCDGSKTGTIYPDHIDTNKQLFEFLLIVRLDRDWKLVSIHQLSWPLFFELKSWDKRMNAWYIGCSRSTLGKCEQIFPS
jgi:hypothetical protein